MNIQSAEQFAQAINQSKEDGVIIDVRTSGEFQSAHIGGSISIPLHELNEENVGQHVNEKISHIYLMCQSGQRSRKAAEKLGDKLNVDIIVVDGGIGACETTPGLAIVRSNKQKMSIERQVRIAAGALVFAGVILGSLVAPMFYWLSGFVGLGLMFAGITDTCMMGMMIARAPWNKS